MAQKVLARVCFERLHPNTVQFVLGAHLEADVALDLCECAYHVRLRESDAEPKTPPTSRSD